MNRDRIYDCSYLNRLNKTRVLDLVWSGRAQTRKDIVHLTGNNMPTVSRLVESLIQDELLREIKQESNGRGRPSAALEFAGANLYCIGLDIGHSKIRIALGDLNAKFLYQKRVPLTSQTGFKTIVAIVCDLIDEIHCKNEEYRERILAVGISIRGLVNKRQNRIAYSSSFGWEDIDLEAELESRVKVPIIFDNDVRVIALGELYFGVGSQYSDFIGIQLGSGIGAAFVMNGQLYRGRDGMVGAFGQMIVDADNPLQDHAGTAGTLEALASGDAVVEEARRVLGDEPQSLIREFCGADPELITAEMVAEAAKRGDPPALRIMERTAQYIGTGIASLINLWHPEAVFLAGGLAQPHEPFWHRIEQTVAEKTLKHLNHNLKIIPVSHGRDAKLVGTVALVLEEVLNLRLNAVPQAQPSGKGISRCP